jgi:hypothetical protein
VVPTGSTAGKTDGVDWDVRQVVIWTDLAAAVVAAEEQLADGT